MKIKIETSARHCHLSNKDLERLFGKNYQLKPIKALSQPGQFASRETIDIKAPNGRINNVRILGPTREATQVEISQTDARQLDIYPPIRQSGDIKKSCGAELIGPKGSFKIKEGVIIAARHIHCDPITAKKLGLKDNQRVSIKTAGIRSVIFGNVIIRIHKDFSWAFHIDADEANAVFDFSQKPKTEYGLLLTKSKK